MAEIVLVAYGVLATAAFVVAAVRWRRTSARAASLRERYWAKHAQAVRYEIEVDRLRAELDQLRAECLHCRQIEWGREMAEDQP